MIFQLIHGLFQIPALSGLSKVWIVLYQAQNRGRSSPAQEGTKQGTEDEQPQVSAVFSRNQRTAGILQCMEDSRAYNKIENRPKSVILTIRFCTCHIIPQMYLLKEPQISQM